MIGTFTFPSADHLAIFNQRSPSRFAAPRMGTNPLTVVFTNTSAGGAAGYLWPGTYIAVLTASNPASVATTHYYFGGQWVAMRKGAEVYYLHGDHLGSTSLTINATGGIVSQARYLPYGQERWTSGPAQTDFTFTGQRADNSTHLIEMGARWYDPQLARWTSADTIVPQPGDPQTLNRYTYVSGNPLRYQDPTGHDGWDKVNNFLMGAACALISIEYDSLLIPSTYPARQPVEALAVAMSNDDAFQAGRVVAGTAAMAQGVAEMVAGATMATGGTIGGVATSETGVGAVAGAGVAVAGAAVATHGAVVGARGMTEVAKGGSNILQAATKGGGKGRGRDYTFPNKKGLARYLGVNEDDIHNIKKDILRDEEIAPLLKKLGSDNPDIGWDDAGNIVLRSETGKTIETKVQINLFIQGE